MSMRKSLTPLQRRVFNFVKSYLRDEGMPPSRREISQRFGWKSTNNAEQHLQLIERKGYLRLLEGKMRGIQIL